ncbi:uncharacterized protein LOC114524123 [Dendronephthya gigantea]|uniref:uncharacterized protein LOC114524123 n=1 Tax=Dendronephthya gigantea TaxID=151771 RepID=UPI00106CBB30|nr:uncharacterized protein LOC114524123 [Dendronephthya gigantea]
MSGLESLSGSDEGSYSCPEYEIEDETYETASKDGYESELSYAVEEELLDDEDVLAYTDEPLADDSWVEEYIQRQEQHAREIEELSLRLSGENPVSSWCNCGNCNTENLVEAKECHCCTEIPNCAAALTLTIDDSVRVSESSDDDATNTQQTCITNHPGFDAICLNRWSLELAADNFKTRTGQKYRQVSSKNRFLRVVAYRQFTRLIHGRLKDKRIPLPACAYNAIRTTFKEKEDDFKGYEDLEEED